MKNLLIRGNGNGLRSVDNTLDISSLNLAIFNRHDAV